jgi:RND family efflux transporter MFP subunit
MTCWLLAALALAHGGVDDEAAPAPPAAPLPDAIGISASSQAFDAVLRVRRGSIGEARQATLLLADWATDAPISGATGALTLSGPGSVTASFTATADAGVYSGEATFPAEGTYAGALVVTTPAASDLLSIAAFDMAEAASPSPGSLGWLAGAAVGGGAILLVGLAGLGVGFLLGRWRRPAAGAAVALILAGAEDRSRAHGGDKEPAPAPAAGGAVVLPMESQFLLGMRTQPLVRAPFRDQAQVSGFFVARPGESATLRAPIAGVIAAPPGGFPSPGQEVHAGDVLAYVEGSVGSADRAAAAASRSAAAVEVAQAKEAFTLAQRDLRQVDALGSSLSERERVERQQAATVAETRLREAEKALTAIGSGASAPVRASVAGVLGPAQARPGDQVEAGQSLFRVIDASALWLEVRVPERLAVGLEAGAPADVRSSAAPDVVLSATVLDAGQEADPSTGMLTATLAVDGEGLGLRPGMGATAWIGRGAARDALVVPDSALVESNGETLVFVKTGPESFRAEPVSLGERSAGVWEVRGGLAPGERVVTEGSAALRGTVGR